MRGSVVGLQAQIDVTFRLQQQPDVAIGFVIDTGFEGALTLPPAAIAALGLTFQQQIVSKLADGSSLMTDVFRAMIIWNGAEVAVAVLAMGNRPLLGTALLHRNDLYIEYEDGGAVRIEPRP